MRLRNDRDLIHVLRGERYDEPARRGVEGRVRDGATADAYLARRCAQAEVLDRGDGARDVVRTRARQSNLIVRLGYSNQAERAALIIIAIAGILIKSADTTLMNMNWYVGR